MTSFLDEIASEILLSKRSFETIKVIVPSQRATLFLRNALAAQIKKPAFAPEILSIENFVEELSGWKKVLPVDLLFECYAAYSEITKVDQRDSFDQFLGWAPTVLSDFNEMDAYLVDSKNFFDFQLSLQQINRWNPQEHENKIVENHLMFWKNMPALYDALNRRLELKQQATSGMIFREAVSNLEYYLENNSKYHYFVGFNALNESEAQIIQEFMVRDLGEVRWDIDQYFYQDKLHAAGRFIREYQTNWKVLRAQPPSLGTHFVQPKEFEIIGVGKNIAQAKYAAQRVTQLAQAYPDEKTALVLGNESLLTPALSAIADTSLAWNVTMGYPLSDTPVSDFFEAFFQLHLNAKNGSIFYRDLKKLYSFPWITSLLKVHQYNTEAQLDEMETKNLYRFPLKKLLHSKDKEDLGQCLFNEIDTMTDFLGRLIRLCQSFIMFLESARSDGAALHLAYFQKVKMLFGRMEVMHQTHAFVENLSILVLVYRALIKGEKVDFLGEPLEGIQIMGLLETRLLDFDNLVITHLNEGILPAGKKGLSFLPFDLKKKFNMPTFLENDAIYTYHFYRLLQRAKRVFLLFNSESDGLNSGEKSRFLHQLKYQKLPIHLMTEKQLVLDYHLASPPVVHVQKTEKIMERLATIAGKGFSPSSLTLYLRNPMDFYDQRVLGLQEKSTMDATINPMEKGNIVHAVLEQLYLPYQNKVLCDHDFEQMKIRLLPLMEEYYRSVYHGTEKITGKNLIIFEVLKKSISDFLEIEQKKVHNGDRIKILFLEQSFEHPLTIPGLEQPLKLTGVVDRIDLYNDSLRIIDYKTGNVVPRQLKLTQWEVFQKDPEYGYLFQVLLYSYIKKDLIADYGDASTGIVSLRNLPQYYMPFSSPNGRAPLDEENMKNFEKVLFEIILEIFDPKIDFMPKA
jgi:ATP-dependent helicase/nuclease subunit B